MTTQVISKVITEWNENKTAVLPPSPNPEEGGRTVLRNVGIQPPHYTAQQPT